MYQMTSYNHEDYQRKLEEIRKKREKLAEMREVMRQAEQERERSPKDDDGVDLQKVKSRNLQLIKEVQQEMARLRTIQPSPLLPQLHQLRDDYLSS